MEKRLVEIASAVITAAIAVSALIEQIREFKTETSGA